MNISRVACILWLAVAFTPASAQTFFSVRSEFGDPIGNGIARSFTPADGAFTARLLSGTTTNGGVEVKVDNGADVNWVATFIADNYQPLITGRYTESRNAPLPFNPGLTLSGSGRTCFGVGEFTILEIVVNAGVVEKFAADLTRRCNGSTGRHFAGIRFNSSIPYAPVFASPAVSLERNGLEPLGHAVSDGYPSEIAFWVRALDAQSRPVPATRVAFEVQGGCGTFVTGSARFEVVTDDLGIAHSPFFYPGRPTGHCITRASLVDGGASLDFDVLIYDVSELTIEPIPGPALAVGVNTSFEIGARILWRGTTPLARARGSFEQASFSGSSSASLSPSLPASAFVDANGRLALNFFSGLAPATFGVRIAAGGASTLVTVQVLAAPPPPPEAVATVLQKTGPAPPAYVMRNQADIRPFSVLALNVQGQPIPDTRVTFAVQGGCGLLAGAASTEVIANSNGVASSPVFVAADVSAICVIRASLPSGAAVDFSTVVYQVSDVVLTPTPSAAVTVPVSQPFQVAVLARWQGAVPMPGLSVAFNHQPVATGAAPSTIFPIFVDADSNGIARVSLAANEFPGTYGVTAGFAGSLATITVTQVAAGTQLPQAAPLVQDMWWVGPSENGWGMSVVQHGENLFAVIYAYDAQGLPTWYVMSNGAWNAAKTSYTGSVYVPHGSPFFAYDASRFVVGAPAGSITISFDDASHATLSYSIFGISGSKRIVRQVLAAPGSSALQGLGDMWWGGASQNGWGLAVLQQFGALFSVWFTYDAQGQATWLVMPDGTWTSPTTYEGRIYRTTGSPYLGPAYDPAAFHVTDVGSFRFRIDGASGTFEYTVDGRSGTLALTRQVF